MNASTYILVSGYLTDLIHTTHTFLKLMEHMSKNKHLLVSKKSKKKPGVYIIHFDHFLSTYSPQLFAATIVEAKGGAFLTLKDGAFKPFLSLFQLSPSLFPFFPPHPQF